MCVLEYQQRRTGCPLAARAGRNFRRSRPASSLRAMIPAMAAGLLSIAAAREAVLAAVQPLPFEAVALDPAALGRVLAEEVTAAGDVPPFRNSAMDGYAVQAGPADRRLPLIGEARAGAPAPTGLRPDTAMRISTGAALPDGADAVVPLERARDLGDEVLLEVEAVPGANVREAGEDMRAGRPVLGPGMGLGPAELGVAIGAGRTNVRCALRPRLAIVATGDELVEAGRPLAPGQIHDSNRPALAALAVRAGAQAIAASSAADRRQATNEALEEAFEQADVVVVSGGISVGRHDHVKQALLEQGVQQRFWGVSLKPGKPTWFGTRDRMLVFGLPGNPVSAMVTFLLFVRPAIWALQGSSPDAARRTALLAADVPRSPARDQALRVRLDQEGATLRARVTGPQGSHILTSMLGADGLALVPSGDGRLTAGEQVTVELI
jgi:molybdopterin molybdotransferase